MANNNNIFNAALGGASAGVASRWLTNTSSASYANQAALILAFATAFDDAIPVDPSGGSRGQCAVVSDICSAFCKDRVLTSSMDMDLAVAPLVALYNELDSSVQPDVGGGGGTTIDGPDAGITVGFDVSADLLLPEAFTYIYVPLLTTDRVYRFLNLGAVEGARVNISGPFTGGQLEVQRDDTTVLFALLDPATHCGEIYFDGVDWLRWSVGA